MGIRNLIASFALLVSATVAQAAPFYPSFHNVDANVLFSNFQFYPNQGMGLQTWSLYNTGSQVLAAGSFDSHVSGAWYARGGLTTAQFSQWFNTYNAQGFRPRELSVMINNAGQPIFSAIWKQRAGEAYYTYINMSDADFTAKWNDLVQNQGFRVEDYIAYTVNGVKKHGAIYVRDGQGFYLWMGMNQAQFNQKFAEMAAQGFYPTSFNAAQTPQGETYSGVWMKATGPTAMYFNMSAAGYQNRFNQMSAQGFRLLKVQGYGAGARFAAIWVK